MVDISYILDDVVVGLELLEGWVVAVIWLVVAIITELILALDDESDEESQESQTEEENRDKKDEVPAEAVAVHPARPANAEEREKDHDEAESECET